MTTHITQCPHCSTAFRVSAEQLSVAKGAVRCGSCLKVFRADEHLRDRMPPTPLRATEPAKKASAAAPAKAPPVAATAHVPKAPPADAPSPFPADDDEFIFSDMAEDDELAEDEFVFMDGDDELDDDFTDSDDELEFSDSFLSLEDTPDPARKRLMVEPEEPDFGDAASDDSWALDMLADAEREPPPRPARPSFDVEPEGISFADADPKPATKRPAKPTPAAPTYAHHDLDELANRLDTQNGKRGLWTLAAALLLITLAAQTLWWQRHTLHPVSFLQPVYAAACAQLPCALEPAKPDRNAVRALSSILRPLADQRMRLDAVFVNRSDRPVPFPSVLLELQDLQGQVIADGLFAPSDYVAGDMRSDDLMPPGQPISISINVNRPTADLSNYSLTFHY